MAKSQADKVLLGEAAEHLIPAGARTIRAFEGTVHDGCRAHVRRRQARQLAQAVRQQPPRQASLPNRVGRDRQSSHRGMG